MVKDKTDLSSLKLIDFGLGDKARTNDERCGTYMYMAPEIVQRNHTYTKSVDIWAIGIIMHQLLTGNKHPLYDPKNDNRDVLIEKLRKVKHVEADSCFSSLAKNLFDKLMSVQISERYTAKEALQHPWITRKLSSDIPINDYLKIERETVLRNKIFLI